VIGDENIKAVVLFLRLMKKLVDQMLRENLIIEYIPLDLNLPLTFLVTKPPKLGTKINIIRFNTS